ncbi:MAG: hypothetical protein WEB13_02470 [Dehalococcoidia bacterium]
MREPAPDFRQLGRVLADEARGEERRARTPDREWPGEAVDVDPATATVGRRRARRPGRLPAAPRAVAPDHGPGARGMA